jgi:hypothetical protein
MLDSETGGLPQPVRRWSLLPIHKLALESWGKSNLPEPLSQSCIEISKTSLQNTGMDGWKIRLQARKRVGLTQSEVGGKFSPPISRVAVSLWEKPVSKGGTAPDGKRLAILSKLYGLTAGQLLGQESVDLDGMGGPAKAPIPARRAEDEVTISVGGKSVSLGTDPEEGLLTLFRGLSPNSQDEVVGYAQQLWISEARGKTSVAAPFAIKPLATKTRT